MGYLELTPRYFAARDCGIEVEDEGLDSRDGFLRYNGMVSSDGNDMLLTVISNRVAMC